MSSSLELPHDMVRRILLNLNLLPADPLPARRVERLLRVQTPVNHIHDELHVGLRLHIAAHNPEDAGKEITAPALSNSQTSSDMRNNSYNWNDRAFLRLKNVEIAYTLPLNVSKKISADKIRFSLSGQNLVTWGRMKNKDIEPEYGGLYTIPAYRVYNVGVSVLF